MTRRRTLLKSVGLTAAATLAPAWLPARAQTWPNQALRIVIPFAAGGTSDVIATMAQRARNVLRSGQRDPANFIVALEVEVAIAAHPASARASVGAVPTDSTGSETVRYIGTPHGLIGLIRDIYAAEVADAVIITPLDGSATEARIREEVIPAFVA